MEPFRGKQQHHASRGYRSSNHQRGCHFGGNNYNTSSSHGYFRTTRIQNPSLKWRKDYNYKGNYKSGLPYRRNDVSGKKLNRSAEDVEEEERKKKLNDTAQKLLSKIETWNAEKSITEEDDKSKEDSQSSVETSHAAIECDPRCGEEKITGDSKKRIAHSKKPKLIKNRTPKRLRQSAKTAAKYEVNKATVKDFQNRIQHKLIEEIMQMPKENLQSVLNDPKINPLMGLKMSRLVQENRPLITQKLRALAESKMKSLGFTSNQQLLVDIDKLIDPVIETDLSALPYELIKQMEHLFQVQFDYSQNGSLEANQLGIDICDSAESNLDQEMPMEMNSLEPSDKLQNNLFKEDLSLYECSTDEDEDISADCPVVLIQEHDLSPSEACISHPVQENDVHEDIKVGNLSGVFQPFPDSGSDLNPTEPPVSTQVHAAESFPTARAVQGASAKTFVPAGCQTDVSFHADASTQTSEEPGLLSGLSLPKQSKDGGAASLLEEVKSIQNLTNKLNERRLMIFLELSRMSPRGELVAEGKIRQNLTETLSNGSSYLLEALEDFFKARSRKNRENSGTFESRSKNR